MSHKYGAVSCGQQHLNCGRHASLREHRRWQELTLLERVGEIRRLREQVSFELAPAVTLNGRRKRALRYVADFVYEERLPAEPAAPEAWAEVVEDAKGVATREFKVKAHLLKVVHGLEVRLA